MNDLIKQLDTISEESNLEWKFLANTKDRYVIFDDGSAYSLWLGNGKRPQWRKVLKKLKHIHLSQKGYHGIRIQTFEGEIKRPRNLYIHRLVAQAFIYNTDSDKVVNHKSGDISDNTITNLEWVTPEQNAYHAAQIGLYKSGEQHHNSTLTKNDVITIKTLIKNQTLKNREIADMINVNIGQVNAIRNSLTWNQVKV